VPSAEAVFAPAFIVLIFEAAFQAQGSPEEALRLMISNLPVVFVGAVPVFFALQWPWRHARQPSGSPTEETEEAEEVR
jgi:membrane protein implicated in regulation of membrane protease activity